MTEVGVVDGVRALAAPLPASVVTAGAFDGVHIGHRALIQRAVESARAFGVPSVAYTFEPHPAKILAPKIAPRTLTPIGEKIALMRDLGIDLVVVEPFDRAFAEVTADAWAESYLVERLHPKHVVVGFNFTYGRDRAGDPGHLCRTGERLGFTVDVVEPVTVDGVVASSTRVREFLLEGNVEGAQMLLGRAFGMTGIVVKGEARGRTIGVPTANLRPENEIVPASGVYATHVIIDPAGVVLRDEKRYPAVTNIGFRPTFAGSGLTIESHLLDFEGDLYDHRIRVEFMGRIRGERRFAGVDELVDQIHADVARARVILAEAAREHEA